MLKNFRVNQWMSPRSSGCRYGAQGELHIVALLSYMTYILYAKYIYHMTYMHTYDNSESDFPDFRFTVNLAEIFLPEDPKVGI